MARSIVELYGKDYAEDLEELIVDELEPGCADDPCEYFNRDSSICQQCKNFILCDVECS